MNTLQESITNSINEAKINYWMIVNVDTDTSFLVAASTLEEAKELVENATGDDEKELFGWLINDLIKVKEPKIVFDSDMIKSKGDKKY